MFNKKVSKIDITNVLVDLTGGIAKKVEIDKDATEEHKKNLFEEMKKYVSQNYLMGCMRNDGNMDIDEDSMSDPGDDEDIISNSMYVILDIREVEDYKLLNLVNYWNRGKWNKQFNPEDDLWETNKALKEKLEYDNINDGTFWIKYSDWLQNFNEMYLCRVFPKNWVSLSIPGKWDDQTSGGCYKLSSAVSQKVDGRNSEQVNTEETKL